jgi:hypothetical protein
LSERAAGLSHHRLAGKRADHWDLGSTAPWQFAVVTAIVDYVCWIGGRCGGTGERRALLVSGMEHIALHERALLDRLLNGSSTMPGLRAITGVTVLLDHDDFDFWGPAVLARRTTPCRSACSSSRPSSRLTPLGFSRSPRSR